MYNFSKYFFLFIIQSTSIYILLVMTIYTTVNGFGVFKKFVFITNFSFEANSTRIHFPHDLRIYE